MRNTSRLVVVLVLAARGLAAQGHEHPAPTEKLGTVHFATSCTPSVAAPFDRAVALLHSFEFGASIRAFSDVIGADSTCAMAYWGIALSRWSNPMTANNRPPAQLTLGRQAADAAARLSSRTTERERLYAAAVGELYKDFEHVNQGQRVVAYEHAMGDLVARQPADTEAKIFHAIALAASAPPTDKTYANQLKAGAILESLFVKHPNHPGLAHYIIHAYDVPALAPQAAAAARRYASIAPSAAHALHMPSHTFTRVGMWNESVDMNRRSIVIATQSGSTAEALHASDYLEYAYLQMRKDSAARAVMLGLATLANGFDPSAVTGAAPGSAGVFAIAAIPARYALERRAWNEAAALEPRTSRFAWTEAMVHFARALGASHTGDAGKARVSIDSLAAIRDRLRTAGEGYWAEQVAIQHLGAQAWLAASESRNDEALTRMREAADREDATEKSSVTPGPLAPARELLGDMLLQFQRPKEALVEYRTTLTREPNRYRTLDGAMRSAAASGDRKAEAAYRAQLKRLTSSS